MARTKIGIIGAGNMGRAFASRLAAAGHTVTITAMDPAHAEEAAARRRANAEPMLPAPMIPIFISFSCPC